jgi:hypothetical protein
LQFKGALAQGNCEVPSVTGERHADPLRFDAAIRIYASPRHPPDPPLTPNPNWARLLAASRAIALGEGAYVAEPHEIETRHAE